VSQLCTGPAIHLTESTLNSTLIFSCSLAGRMFFMHLYHPDQIMVMPCHVMVSEA